MGPGWDQPRPSQTPVLWFENHSRLYSTMTLQPAVTLLMSPLHGSNTLLLLLYSSTCHQRMKEGMFAPLSFCSPLPNPPLHAFFIQTHFSYCRGKDRSILWSLNTKNTIDAISWLISKVSPWPRLLFMGVVQIRVMFRSWREAAFWEMGSLL